MKNRYNAEINTTLRDLCISNKYKQLICTIRLQIWIKFILKCFVVQMLILGLLFIINFFATDCVCREIVRILALSLTASSIISLIINLIGINVFSNKICNTPYIPFAYYTINLMEDLDLDSMISIYRHLKSVTYYRNKSKLTFTCYNLFIEAIKEKIALEIPNYEYI